MTKVICKSGVTGNQSKLRSRYRNFEEFKSYSEIYGLHKRLGYETPEDCWKLAKDKIVQSSVIPSDFRIVTIKQSEEAKNKYKKRQKELRKHYL